MKYIGGEHRDHLFRMLDKYYEMETDYTEELHCRMALKWNYEKEFVDISNV